MSIGPSPNAGLIYCAVVSSALISNASAELNKAAMRIEDVNEIDFIMRVFFNNNNPPSKHT